VPKFEFTMFGKFWKISSVEELPGGGKLVEYTTGDAAGDSWVFMLSAQSDPTVADVLESGDASAFIQLSLDSLKWHLEQRDGWLRVIDVTPLEYCIEMYVPASSDGPAEITWQRHVFTEQGVYSFMLASRDIEVDEATKNKWIDELRGALIA